MIWINVWITLWLRVKPSTCSRLHVLLNTVKAFSGYRWLEYTLHHHLIHSHLPCTRSQPTASYTDISPPTHSQRYIPHTDTPSVDSIGAKTMSWLFNDWNLISHTSPSWETSTTEFALLPEWDWHTYQSVLHNTGSTIVLESKKETESWICPLTYVCWRAKTSQTSHLDLSPRPP